MKNSFPRWFCSFLLSAGVLVSPLWSAETPPSRGEPKLLLHKLLGLVLTQDPNRIVPKGVSGVTGVQVLDIPFLDQADFKARVHSYFDKPFTEESLANLLRDIREYYREKGRPVVDIGPPEQDITNRVLQLLVLEGKVGQVRVEGNKWFKPGRIRGQFQTKSGQEIQTDQLLKDLAWINRNPFRQVDLVYAKGSEFGTTDLVLRQTDRFPLRVYAGYENSGNRETDDTRWLSGFNWGNAFGIDGLFNYQFIASPDIDTFRAHSAGYTQPLPWRHLLTIFGSHARTQANVQEPFDLNGYGWQTGARYEVPLPASAVYQHSVVAGFDFKRTDNNLLFGGVSVFTSPTDTAQWSLGYNGSRRDSWGATSLRATAYYSPGQWASHDNDADYQASRAGASATYVYGKLELNRVTKLPKNFSMVNLVTAQLSDGPLLSGEQLGLGGYDTVRGFKTRFVNADQGYILSQEFRTPALSIISRWSSRFKDQLQFLGYVDYGAGYNKGDDSPLDLMAVGPGLRYSIAKNFTLRVDYGFPIIGSDTPRVHAGATLSF